MTKMDNNDKKRVMKWVLEAENFTLEKESDWDTLLEHIEVHKYFINQRISWTITWDDALFSWHENVFAPIISILSHRQVNKAFPGKSTGELFFDISTHWYFLSEKTPRISYMDAALDYLSKYGKGISKILAMWALPLVA
ncbi:MAG: hypothetical protein E4H36_11410 [Spirochaetales bacterium]|nr:MAG: hypothetical protein E4H36_11410 [Spirochaetales bacterium]